MEQASKPIDRYIPWFFVLFFVVLTIALGVFTWIAISSNRGLVTEDAYKKGLAYNSIIEKQRQQDALGWKADMAVTGQPDGMATIRFTLKDRDGKAVQDATVQAVYVRPAQEGHDVRLALPALEAGVYGAAARLPLAGLWNVHVTAQKGKDSFQHSQRITLP